MMILTIGIDILEDGFLAKDLDGSRHCYAMGLGIVEQI